MAKSLFVRDYRYRKNDKSVFRKPDLTFKKYKIAIFVDSEFWNGKDWSTCLNHLDIYFHGFRLNSSLQCELQKPYNLP
ncbi:hypothetical protein [Apibacter mensalis]|uniref:hypothetical protein n=1 Tax=Apibacter mensalis TaxID=1586267 RepID=UPI001FDF93A6|nr:hypothetical protein [Apibacter mensalis]